MAVKRRKGKEEQFIEGAISDYETPKKGRPLKSTTDPIKPKIFTLERSYDKKIQMLSIRSRHIKTSRSDIIRAGVILLEKLNQEEFEQLIIEIINK